MIVYHGSNSNFKKLRIAKSLVQHQSTLENEGLGIYFTTDKEIAKSYGKWIYSLEIPDDMIDFRDKKACTKYINAIRSKVLKEFNVDIFKYFDYNQFITCVHCGGIAIHNIGSRQLPLMLDSSYEWYEDIKPTKMNKIYASMRKFDKELKVYMFTYHIQNIGIIRTTDENIVRIISKESAY